MQAWVLGRISFTAVMIWSLLRLAAYFSTVFTNSGMELEVENYLNYILRIILVMIYNCNFVLRHVHCDLVNCSIQMSMRNYSPVNANTSIAIVSIMFLFTVILESLSQHRDSCETQKKRLYKDRKREKER